MFCVSFINLCPTNINTAGSSRESSFIRELSSEDLLWGGGGGGGEEREGGEGWSEELEELVRQEQQAAVNESLHRLQTGLNEAKVGGDFSLSLSLSCMFVHSREDVV